eukprot:NODE_1030_length_1310_cov_167.789849_g849_i0.p1 GENE.NODE_1030_length_1310_cov_167.789849_g849_i0~~NODE_1030_length_1310_cov_167.789849_g849_i0.p1  ORF type:complete len:276 (+),score=64.23 NODE_1030_length_1310_cov_167.789849_g849_i0:395-1222(+)
MTQAPKVSVSLRNLKVRDASLSSQLDMAPGRCGFRTNANVPFGTRALLLAASVDISGAWRLYSALKFKAERLFFTVGVSLRMSQLQLILSLQSGVHTCRLPITVSATAGWRSTAYLSGMTALATALARSFLVLPFMSWMRRREVEQQAEAAREKLDRDYNRAMTLQVILTRLAEERLAAERAVKGLVILQAEYGCLRLPTPAPPATICMDVTVPCQSFVDGSCLVLPAGTKSKLDGFCDTDPLGQSSKRLRIRYMHGGAEHTVDIDDCDELRLPT